MHRPSIRVFAAAACLLPSLAFAENTELAVQGLLRAQGGGPVADGPYPVALSLYAKPDDAKALFDEKFLAVMVQGGLFSVTLGAPAGGETLDDALFASGKAKWLGVQVGGDPELPRVPLHAVPYAVHARGAQKAFGLECSGCVDASDLAAGAVTGDKLAPGSVDAKHVAFAYAGSQQKGGPADLALVANVAKQAEMAAAADTAKSAAIAEKLQCTGCVTAAMVANDFAKGLVTAKQLAPVALSGKYGDLDGGPDLSGYGKLDAANAWQKGASFAGSVDLKAQQVQNLRLQNADKAPVTCDGNSTGFVYYDTVQSALMVCNGKQFFPVKLKQPIGSQDEPGKNCKHIRDENGPLAASGVYWIKPSNTTFQAYCDMQTEPGGWTRVFSIKFGSSCNNMTAGAHGDPKNSGEGCAKYSDALINELATEKVFYSRVGANPPLYTKYENAIAINANPGKVVNAETFAAVKAAGFVKVPGYGGWIFFHQHDWYQPDTCVGSKASSIRLSLEYITGGGPKYACGGSCGGCGTNYNSELTEVYVR